MFGRQRLEFTGREMHEAEALGRLQKCRRAHEEAARLVSQAEGTLTRAQLRETEAATLLRVAQLETRRVTQS